MEEKKVSIQEIDRLLVQMYCAFLEQIEEAMWVEKPKAERIFKEVFKETCRAKLKL